MALDDQRVSCYRQKGSLRITSLLRVFAVRGNLSVLFVLICSVCCSRLVLAQSDGAAVLKAELQSQWELLSTGIVSAEVEFTSCVVIFQTSDSMGETRLVFPKPSISPDEFVALFDRYDLIAHPEQRDDFLNEALAGQSPAASPWIENRRLLIKGERVKDQSSEGTQVLDAENFLSVDPVNRQITINQRGRYPLGYYKLADFYQHSSNPGAILEEWTLSDRSNEGLIELRPPARDEKSQGTMALVDAVTGVPVRWRGVQGGDILGDHLNRNIVTLPNGFPFPLCSAKAVYMNGQLAQLRMQLVKKVLINEPVADTEFVVNAVIGDKLFDRRVEPIRGVRLDQPVDDVLTYFHADSQTTTPGEPTPARFSGWQTLLVVNGLAFLLIGVLIWRRSRDTDRVLNP